MRRGYTGGGSRETARPPQRLPSATYRTSDRVLRDSDGRALGEALDDALSDVLRRVERLAESVSADDENDAQAFTHERRQRMDVHCYPTTRLDVALTLTSAAIEAYLLYRLAKRVGWVLL